jgi:DNA-binding NtrC family response regulator
MVSVLSDKAGAETDRPPRKFFKILIVDDEHVVRKLLLAILTEDGYVEIDEADSGEGAVAAFSQKEYHLILLDKNLPGMDGIEVLKRAKTSRPDTEVIIITAYASLESAVEAMELGALSYINKPFTDINLVQRRVESALDRATNRYHVGQLLARLDRVQDLLKKAEGEMGREAMSQKVKDASGRLRLITADLKQLA